MVLVHIGSAYPAAVVGSHVDVDGRGEDELTDFKHELLAAMRESIGDALVLATAKAEAVKQTAAEREASEQKQRADAAESRARTLEADAATTREQLKAVQREAAVQKDAATAAAERARALESDAAAMRVRLEAAEREEAEQMQAAAIAVEIGCAAVLRAEAAERSLKTAELLGLSRAELEEAERAAAAKLLVRPGESIMEAVRRADPGQTIFLAPGWYKEQVVLEKEVRIIAIGQCGAVLDGGNRHALKCIGPAAPSVKGITIRNTSKTESAVWISDGSRAILEGCDVSSSGWRGIEVRGEGTAPVLRSNVVHDCVRAGIVFDNLAKGTAEKNDVFGNALTGIAIVDGADPFVRDNKVHGGKRTGIFVLRSGQGIVEANDVFGNVLAGIAIFDGAHPIVRNNKVHDWHSFE